MDEVDFDKIIKDKLDNFEDPHVDEHAYGALSARLDSSVSWWKSKTAITTVIVAALVTTGLNIIYIWHHESAVGFQNKNLAPVDHRIDSLKTVIEQLMAHNNNDEKTLRIDKINSNQKTTVQVPVVPINQTTTLLTIANDLPFADYKSPVASENLISTIWQTPAIPKTKLIFTSPNVIKPTRHKSGENEISARLRNKLEKHYFTGIGIYLGHHLDGNVSFWSKASGIPGYKTGIAADFVVSPRFSVEANLDFAKIRSVVNKNYESIPVRPYNDLGDLSKVVVTNNLVGGNISFKYRQWISEQDQVFIKAGTSPYFSLSNRYELKYDVPGGYDHDDSKPASQVQKLETRQYLGTTLTFGAGITRNHLKKNKVELGLFYERSVGSNTFSESHGQLAGLRMAYWFRVR